MVENREILDQFPRYGNDGGEKNSVHGIYNVKDRCAKLMAINERIYYFSDFFACYKSCACLREKLIDR